MLKEHWMFFILQLEYCFLSMVDLSWEIHCSEVQKRKKVWVAWYMYGRSWLQLRIKSTKELQERFMVGKKAKEENRVMIPQIVSLFREVAGGPSYLFCGCPFHHLCCFYFNWIWRHSDYLQPHSASSRWATEELFPCKPWPCKAEYLSRLLGGANLSNFNGVASLEKQALGTVSGIWKVETKDCRWRAEEKKAKQVVCIMQGMSS